MSHSQLCHSIAIIFKDQINEDETIADPIKGESTMLRARKEMESKT